MSAAQQDLEHDKNLRGVSAIARVVLPMHTWQQLVDNMNAKGDVLAVARLAGMMAAEQTGTLAPGYGLSHHPHLHLDVKLAPSVPGQVLVNASAASHGSECVGMVAMTAAAVSALTVYDMCKASSKSCVIQELTLSESYK
mmetsp:Transcript_32012/g.95626  ORF Transcript_32012/g.95626 Transcript_32012/m.95626 type:complete len:140 (+) Transcript_32012:1243-1662(+)